MRALIVAGGTGGHVIPGIAIAQDLRTMHDCQCLFVGTARGMESRLVPQAGFELMLIEASGFKGMGLLRRLRSLLLVPRSALRCLRILRDFRPQVVISVGGYASGPVMLAAWWRRVPALIFEPNVVPGLANRIAARFAKAAAVHFEQTGRWFRSYEVTGVPVRKEFFEVAPRPTGPTSRLFVFGGSQGSHILNETMTGSLSALRERVPGLSIIHQTGEREYEAVRRAYDAAAIPATVAPFIPMEKMPATFADADLVVCRSGASTVAEVAAAGRAAVFIPFAAAADQHQLRNAELLASRAAAELIPESELTTERFVETVAGLLNDPKRRAAMAAAARTLAHPGAAAHIGRMAKQLAMSDKQ